MTLDLYRAVLRNDLVSFIRQSFGTTVPGQTFHMNWHVDALAHVLERCRRGEIKRLIVLMPPRNLKSIAVSVAFPAFANPPTIPSAPRGSYATAIRTCSTFCV